MISEAPKIGNVLTVLGREAGMRGQRPNDRARREKGRKPAAEAERAVVVPEDIRLEAEAAWGCVPVGVIAVAARLDTSWEVRILAAGADAEAL